MGSICRALILQSQLINLLITPWILFFTGKESGLKTHTYQLHGRDVVHYRKIEIDANDKAVYLLL